ncbi:MAG: hypothetical protein JWO12_3451, partial [Frankiales bacterium]|nr:hypothetical protein [Frankiales bacterium]
MAGYHSLLVQGALARLAELEAQSAVVFAEQQQALIDLETVSTALGDTSNEFLALDVAASCGIAQSTATVRLRQARQLVQTLPRLHALALEGAVHVGQLKAILEATADSTPETAAQVEAALLPA